MSRFTWKHALWFGVALAALGALSRAVLINVLFTIGGQDLASSQVASVVGQIFAGVLLPMGAGFIAVAFVARMLGRGAPDAPADKAAVAHERIARAALLATVTGVALIVVGLLVPRFLWQELYTSESSAAVAAVLDALASILLPLGTVLIPCAWLMRVIADRFRPEREGHRII